MDDCELKAIHDQWDREMRYVHLVIGLIAGLVLSVVVSYEVWAITGSFPVAIVAGGCVVIFCGYLGWRT